ncbi:MAG: hypothetical protein ACJAW3_001332 [Lentimonas sp.]|jgi:hypothetical protein
MQDQIKLKIKELAREIAKYPDHRFTSNESDPRYIKLSYYMSAREPSIENWKIARDALEKLESGEYLFVGVFL